MPKRFPFAPAVLGYRTRIVVPVLVAVRNGEVGPFMPPAIAATISSNVSPDAT
jgi:hypothetical protein